MIDAPIRAIEAVDVICVHGIVQEIALRTIVASVPEDVVEART